MGMNSPDWPYDSNVVFSLGGDHLPSSAYMAGNDTPLTTTIQM